MKNKYKADANSRGKFAEKLVKQNLWRRNYRVKDVSYAGFGYDLLVDEKWRVEVKSLSGDTTMNLDVEKFDVLTLVYLGLVSNDILYLKDKKNLKKLNKTGTIYAISKQDLIEYFTKKPQEVFSKY